MSNNQVLRVIGQMLCTMLDDLIRTAGSDEDAVTYTSELYNELKPEAERLARTGELPTWMRTANLEDDDWGEEDTETRER